MSSGSRNNAQRLPPMKASSSSHHGVGVNPQSMARNNPTSQSPIHISQRPVQGNLGSLSQSNTMQPLRASGFSGQSSVEGPLKASGFSGQSSIEGPLKASGFSGQSSIEGPLKASGFSGQSNTMERLRASGFSETPSRQSSAAPQRQFSVEVPLRASGFSETPSRPSSAAPQRQFSVEGSSRQSSAAPQRQSSIEGPLKASGFSRQSSIEGPLKASGFPGQSNANFSQLVDSDVPVRYGDKRQMQNFTEYVIQRQEDKTIGEAPMLVVRNPSAPLISSGKPDPTQVDNDNGAASGFGHRVFRAVQRAGFSMFGGDDDDDDAQNSDGQKLLDRFMSGRSGNLDLLGGRKQKDLAPPAQRAQTLVDERGVKVINGKDDVMYTFINENTRGLVCLRIANREKYPELPKKAREWVQKHPHFEAACSDCLTPLKNDDTKGLTINELMTDILLDIAVCRLYADTNTKHFDWFATYNPDVGRTAERFLTAFEVNGRSFVYGTSQFVPRLGEFFLQDYNKTNFMKHSVSDFLKHVIAVKGVLMFPYSNDQQHWVGVLIDFHYSKDLRIYICNSTRPDTDTSHRYRTKIQREIRPLLDVIQQTHPHIEWHDENLNLDNQIGLCCGVHTAFYMRFANEIIGNHSKMPFTQEDVTNFINFSAHAFYHTCVDKIQVYEKKNVSFFDNWKPGGVWYEIKKKILASRAAGGGAAGGDKDDDSFDWHVDPAADSY